MKSIFSLFLLLLVSLSSEGYELFPVSEDAIRNATGGHSLQEYLEKTLEKFRSQMETKIPDSDIPILEPLNIGRFDESYREGKTRIIMKIGDMSLSGLSNFDAKLNVSSEDCHFYIKITLPELRVDSDKYTIEGKVSVFPFWSSGRFHVIIHNPEVYVKGKVGLNPSGKLEVGNIETDADFDHMRIDWGRMKGRKRVLKSLDHYFRTNIKHKFHNNKSKLLIKIINVFEKMANKILEPIILQ